MTEMGRCHDVVEPVRLKVVVDIDATDADSWRIVEELWTSTLVGVLSCKMIKARPLRVQIILI